MIVSQNDYERKADDSDGEGKNRPVATNFQLLKILAPFGTASCWGVPAPNPAGENFSPTDFHPSIYIPFEFLYRCTLNGIHLFPIFDNAHV